MTTRARRVRRNMISDLLLRHATDFKPFTAYDVIGWWRSDKLRAMPSIRTVGKILPGLNIERLERDDVADPIYYRLKKDELGKPVRPYILCLEVPESDS